MITINGSPHIKMAAGLSPWDHLFFRVESSLQTGFVHKSGCLPISVCSHQPALGQLLNFRAYSWLLFLNVLSLDNFLYFMPSWCPTGQVSSESYLHGFLKHKSPLGFREDNTQLSNPLDEHALAWHFNLWALLLHFHHSLSRCPHYKQKPPRLHI